MKIVITTLLTWILIALAQVLFAQKLSLNFTQTYYYKPDTSANSRLPEGSMINLGIGAGMPLGEFGASKLTDKKAGFAKTGVCGAVELTVPLAASYFGIACSAGYGTYAVNTSAVANQEINVPADNTFSCSAASYHLTTLTAGVYRLIPLHKFAIVVKGLAGLSILDVPSQSATVTNHTSGNVTQTNVNSFTAASGTYGGALIEMYAIKRGKCIFLQEYIMHSNEKYNVIDYSRNNFLPAINVGHQPVTLLCIMAGISYMF